MGQQNSALRLRNRNIRSGLQRLNRSNISSRVQLRLAAGNTLTLAGGFRRLQRSNSLSDIATRMNADYYERQPLKHFNSQASLAFRLGNGRPGRSRSRVCGRSQQRNQSRSQLGNPRRACVPRSVSRSASVNGRLENNRSARTMSGSRRRRQGALFQKTQSLVRVLI